jgi:hypothetical protein
VKALSAKDEQYFTWLWGKATKGITLVASFDL